MVNTKHKSFFLITALSLLLLSCVDSNDDQTSPEDLTVFSIYVAINDSLKLLHLKNAELMDLSIRIDDGQQQFITLTSDGASRSITGLAEGQYNIAMEIRYTLQDNTIILASYDTLYELTDESDALNVLAKNLVVNIHDDDNDGVSNLDELLALTNPLGSSILPISSNEYTVTAGVTDIATLAAYAVTNEQALNYRITGGQDQNLFALDIDTGNLSFTIPPVLNVVLSDNTYHVTISISDNIYSITQNISVRVTDLFATAITSQFKSIIFDWNAIDDAGHYSLFGKTDAGNDFFLISNNITSTDYTRSVSLHLYDKNTIYKLQAYDQNDQFILASNDFRIASEYLDSIGILKPPDSRSSGIKFGQSMGMSANGQVLAISANLEECVSGDNCPGAVNVYVLTNNAWVSAARLERRDRSYSEWDSISLSSNGRLLAIGAPNADADTSEVYLYEQTNSTWSLNAVIQADNPNAGDRFGAAIALSGDGLTLAVSAPYEDSAARFVNGNPINNCDSPPPRLNCGTDSGAVYLFRRNNNLWTQQAYIKASNTKATIYPGSGTVGFGLYPRSISLSSDGNTLVVGSIADDSRSTEINGTLTDGCGTYTAYLCDNSSGAVYTYQFVEGGWKFDAHIKAINSKPGLYFGKTVALSGDGMILAVGTTQESSGSEGINGDSESDCYAPNPQNCSEFSGAVYLYRKNQNLWQHDTYIKPPYNPTQGTGFRGTQIFGSSVHLSEDGTGLAVGMRGDGSAAVGVNGELIFNCDYPLLVNCNRGSGAVLYYRIDGDQWPEPVYIKAPNALDGSATYGNRFGTHIAMNHDGSTLVVTAPYENSIASGFNDPTSGVHLIFDRPSSGVVYIY